MDVSIRSREEEGKKDADYGLGVGPFVHSEQRDDGRTKGERGGKEGDGRE